MQLSDGVCQKHRPLVFLAGLLLVKEYSTYVKISIDLYWVNYIPVSITGQICTFSVLLTIQLLALKS